MSDIVIRLGPEIFRHTHNLSSDCFGFGRQPGMIGCARNRRSKEGGKTPDHGIGADIYRLTSIHTARYPSR